MIGAGLDCLHPIYVREGVRHLRCPCGHCINCKIKRTRDWTLRLDMEALYWKDIAFITLTYDEEHVPWTLGDVKCRELQSQDVTNFFKRLRKALDYKIKYYVVGEYGSRTSRPHYHAIVYGLKLKDDRLIAEKWKNGFVDVRPFLQGASNYVSGYIQKKLYGPEKVTFRNPEFMHCSRGIGYQWLIDNAEDLDRDAPIVNVKGMQYGLPRQFVRLLTDPTWCEKHNLEPFPKLTVELNIDLQLLQYRKLREFLASTKTDEKDFWANRKIISQERFIRKNAKRDTNYEV